MKHLHGDVILRIETADRLLIPATEAGKGGRAASSSSRWRNIRIAFSRSFEKTTIPSAYEKLFLDAAVGIAREFEKRRFHPCY